MVRHAFESLPGYPVERTATAREPTGIGVGNIPDAHPARAVVVLAAGHGKRMKSDLPKVLHPVAGRPIIEHVLRAAEHLDPKQTLVVVGHGAELVKAALPGGKLEFVLQAEQLGTGHAVLQARPSLAGFSGTILVLVGDVPLLRGETLQHLCETHESQNATCTILSTKLEDPTGYGRIVRDAAGIVQGIVEQRDASSEQQRIREINSGILVFASDALWSHIDRLGRSNAQAEYYLTDLVQMYVAEGLPVAAWCVEDSHEVLGINSREQLADVERIYREKVLPGKGIDRP